MTGKEKCELLKQIRKEIAEANGIVYLTSECTFQGECLGYCPKCDAEARYIDSELNRLASNGHQIIASDITYKSFLDKIDQVTSDNSTNDNTEVIIEGQGESFEDKVLAMTIEELDFSEHTFQCLKKQGVTTIKDLTELSRTDILYLEGISEDDFNEIIHKMNALGFSPREDIILGGCFNGFYVGKWRLEELDFSVRTVHCIEKAGIKTVDDLMNKSESEMIQMRNRGKKVLMKLSLNFIPWDSYLKKITMNWRQFL